MFIKHNWKIYKEVSLQELTKEQLLEFIVNEQATQIEEPTLQELTVEEKLLYMKKGFAYWHFFRYGKRDDWFYHCSFWEEEYRWWRCRQNRPSDTVSFDERWCVHEMYDKCLWYDKIIENKMREWGFIQ